MIVVWEHGPYVCIFKLSCQGTHRVNVDESSAGVSRGNLDGSVNIENWRPKKILPGHESGESFSVTTYCVELMLMIVE